MFSTDLFVFIDLLLKNRNKRRHFARKAKQIKNFQKRFRLPESHENHFRNWLLELGILYSSEQLDGLLAYEDFDTLKEVSYDELREKVGRLTAHQLTFFIKEAQSYLIQDNDFCWSLPGTEHRKMLHCACGGSNIDVCSGNVHTKLFCFDVDSHREIPPNSRLTQRDSAPKKRLCQFSGCQNEATFFSGNADGDRVKLCKKHAC